MGNTFMDVWLTPLTNSTNGTSLLASREFLQTLPAFYCLDDANTVKSVQMFVTPRKLSKPIELTSYNIVERVKSVKGNFLDKGICLYCVKECIEQLSIMVSLDQSELGTVEAESFTYNTLEERFGATAPNQNSYVIGGVYNELHKIQKDLKVLIIVLKEMYDEFNTFSETTCLSSFIETYYNMKNDEETLLEESKKKRSTIKNLQNELKNDRNDIAKKFEQIEIATINKTKELKDFSAYAGEALKYIEKWQKSRCEQNTMTLQSQENQFRSLIDSTSSKLYDEDMCHRSLETFYDATRLEYANEIEKWMDRYDTEIEQKDLEIRAINSEIERTTEKQEKLQEMYDTRLTFIADFLEYKALKRQREEELAAKNKCATKIQAWWRGVMVRKKLGPYRKKKKGKNKKKGKK